MARKLRCRRADSRLRAALVVHPARASGRSAGPAGGLGPQSHRRVRRGPSGARRPRPFARGSPVRPVAAAEPGFDRFAPEPRRGRRAGRGWRLRAGRGAPAGFAPLRGSAGAPLAGPGPLRRERRLPGGLHPAVRLALAPLGDRRLQPQPRLRPVHGRADRRGSASGRHRRAARRDGLSPERFA